MNPPTADALDLTILTGLSGAGKSLAANVLEDLGFFVIDNLPASLLSKMADLAMEAEAPRRHAVVVDVRSGAFVDELARALADLRKRGARTRILFFDANDDVLIRRFEGTRRPHPLSDGETLSVGIAHERTLLEPLRGESEFVIDTSEYTQPDLRERLRGMFLEAAEHTLQVNVMSFGYKHGLPLDADVVLDCRFLPNPHWVEELRPRTGLDAEVRAFVLDQPEAKAFLAEVERMLAVLLPAYFREGKSYLTLGVGCTGGRHRSVVMAGEIARSLDRLGYPPMVTNRDIDRD
jgi:UPF0042 nucleotide-binding protein